MNRKTREKLLSQIEFVVGNGDSCILQNRVTKDRYILSTDGVWRRAENGYFFHRKEVRAWLTNKDVVPAGQPIEDKQWIDLLILAAFPHWIPNLS